MLSAGSSSCVGHRSTPGVTGLTLNFDVDQVDFPDKAKFLKPEERALVLDRIQRDRGDAVYEEVTLASLASSLTDLRLWAFAICFLCATMPAYVVAYFQPTILLGMGYSRRDSQLLVSLLHCLAQIVTF